MTQRFAETPLNHLIVHEASPSLAPISQLAEINPALAATNLSPSDLVSFIPMSDISEQGRWTGREMRKLGDVSKGYTPFKEGDLLFAKITPCMENGKGAHVRGLINEVGYGSTEFHVLRARDSTEPRYLYHWLQSSLLRLRAEVMMTGSAGQRRVPAEFFNQFQIPLLSLPEQRRIAEILDTVDEAIRKTEEVIAKLKQVKAGLLHDLLTRGIDEHGQLRDPIAHAEQFKDSPLGRIPREWAAATVDALGHWSGGSTPSKAVPSFWKDGTVPWISPKDFIAQELHESEDYVTDLALSRTNLNLYAAGQLATVFRSGILRHAFPVARVTTPFTVNQDVKVLSTSSDVSAAFAFHLLHGLEPLVLTRAVKSGTTVESIDLTTFLKLPVALPRLNEQKRIADILDGERIRYTAEQEYAAKLRMVKQGLMQDLLTGRMRASDPAAISA